MIHIGSYPLPHLGIEWGTSGKLIFASTDSKGARLGSKADPKEPEVSAVSATTLWVRKKNLRLPISLVHSVEGGADGINFLEKDRLCQLVTRLEDKVRICSLFFYPQRRLFFIKPGEDSAGEAFSEWIQRLVDQSTVASATLNPAIDILIYLWLCSRHDAEQGR